MDKILHDPKDPKLWELWYIPYYGSCRILSISREDSYCLSSGSGVLEVDENCFQGSQGQSSGVIGTLRGVGRGGVGGLNAHNKDLIRPI